jgi:3-methyladenine DNA glycosylase AlkD
VPTSIVQAARDGLAGLADPAKAPDMRRYMRSAMPFLGVQRPARKDLVRRLLADHPLDRAGFEAAVRELWDGAEFREERYVALEITGARRFAGWQTPELLPLYQEWIVTGAWWDFVDEIASRRVGPMLRGHPATLRPVVREWTVVTDRWLRRTSIICQLGAKDRTDLALLTEAIEANIDDPDFFLRKAIGWALRQYARTDSEWVRTFVDAHPGLSPLSRREALKHLLE